MYLSTYLKKNNMTYGEFAEFSNLGRITIYKILQGTDMYLSTAKRIVEATKGDVTYKDLYDERQEETILKEAGYNSCNQKHQKKSNKTKNK